jgi:hypothetical protein
MINLDSLLDEVVAETLQKAGELGVKTAQQTDLFQASHSFQEQIITKPTAQNSQVIWSQAPWSSYLEYGNNQQGDFIYPKVAKALSFTQNGQTVFYKKVRAHGPLPYMQQAQEEIEFHIDEIWETTKREIFK